MKREPCSLVVITRQERSARQISQRASLHSEGGGVSDAGITMGHELISRTLVFDGKRAPFRDAVTALNVSGLTRPRSRLCSIDWFADRDS